MYSDERQFNSVGVRIPYGSLMRSPPGKFSTYHTSHDDLSYVKAETLLKSLEVYWKAICALERTVTYKANFTVEPFLTGYGIYPFDLGAGEGTSRGGSASESMKRYDAYHHLMWNIDGKTDLLEIADKSELDIEFFDRPVSEFLKAGLMSRVDSR